MDCPKTKIYDAAKQTDNVAKTTIKISFISPLHMF
jgi:hypothetical protein